MNIDRESVLVILVCSFFVIDIYAFFSGSIFLILTFSILLVCLILEILWQFLTHSFQIIKKLAFLISVNDKIVNLFVFFPLLYVLCFEMFLLTYNEADWKKILIDIYTVYITLTTVFLSVSFLFISIIPAIKTNSRVARKLKNAKAVKINYILLSYCVTGIALTFVSFVITSLSSSKTLSPSIIFYFLLSSFFVSGSVFGLYLLALTTTEIWPPNQS
jgi:hypothetical protein